MRLTKVSFAASAHELSREYGGVNRKGRHKMASDPLLAAPTDRTSSGDLAPVNISNASCCGFVGQRGAQV